MKAVQIHTYGGPEVLETVEIDEPIPNQNEVKIKLYATGLNPSESYTITGEYAYNKPDLPYTPGYDGAGTIEEVGLDVSKFKIGDRVYLTAFSAERNTGTYAEKIVVDANNVFALPDNIPFIEGAGLGIPAYTAYKALFLKARVRAGETVLIHGASGAVGSLIVQMAKAIGAIVIGTSSTEEGRQLISDLGADYALNHISEENKEDLSKLTNEKGPDVIVEMLANANLETDSEVVAKYGRIVVVGSRGTIDFTPRNLMTNEASITGMTFTYPTSDEMQEMEHGINAFLKTGVLKPVIGKTFTLDEPQKAHKALMESSGDGRTVFLIDRE